MELYYIALRTRMSSSLANNPNFTSSSLGLAPDIIHVSNSDTFVYATERISFSEENEAGHSIIIFFDFKSLCGKNMVGHKLGKVGDFISVEENIDYPETDTVIYCKTCLKNASFLRGVKEHADKGNRN